MNTNDSTVTPNEDATPRGAAAAWALLGLVTFACFIGGLVIGLLVGR